jgi:hypothetical protein
MAQLPRRPLFWQIVHCLLIGNMVLEVIYAGYMVFVVVKPEGAGFGPLGAAAKAISFEMMVTRRLYAAEFWIAFAGLAIYLAITEIKPRFYAGGDEQPRNAD